MTGVTTAGQLAYEVTKDQKWISTSYGTGFTIYPNTNYHMLTVGNTGTVNVKFDPSGLTSGTYSGNIIVKASTRTKTIPVTFTVNPSEEICGDGIDNDCNGKIDEECKKEKKLEYVSGDGQEGLICEELKEPFKVKVTDNLQKGQSGVPIGWETLTGDGTSGAAINPASSTTDSEGLAETYLTLGSVAGEYKVDAICSECAEGNPQTFTATAKCPDPADYYYYQIAYSDPYDNWCKYTYIDQKTREPVTLKGVNCKRDANEKLLPGYEQHTIHDLGCNLTCASMIMKKNKISGSDPPILDRKMNKLPDGYRGGGFDYDRVKEVADPPLYLIYFRDTGSLDVPVQPIEMQVMDAYLARCIPVVVKVRNVHTDGRVSQHYVLVTEKDGGVYKINDPGYQSKKTLSEYNNTIYGIKILQKATGGGCEND